MLQIIHSFFLIALIFNHLSLLVTDIPCRLETNTSHTRLRCTGVATPFISIVDTNTCDNLP